MKKVFNLLSIFLLCFIISSCTTGYGVKHFDAMNKKIDSLEYTKDAKLNYYDDFSKLTQLNNDVFNKYDKIYFKESSLILITLEDNEDIEYTLEGIKNGVIAINRNVNIESQMTNWTLLLEVDGKIPDINNFYIHFNTQEKQVGHTHNYQATIITPTCLKQGYTEYVCDCKESYKDNYTDIVECEYENNKCIWCGHEKPDWLMDNYYTGIQIATTYSFIEEYYHDVIEIKNKHLYILKENYGEFTSTQSTDELFDKSTLKIKEGFEEIISKIQNVKDIFVIERDEKNVSRIFYLVPLNKDIYLVTIGHSKINQSVTTNVMFLDDNMVHLHFYEEDNSCTVDEVYKYVERNKDYIIDFDDMAFFTDTFINLETLSIYKKTIFADKHMNLVPYSYEDGVFYTFIVRYIFEHGNFHFKNQYVTQDEIEQYENAVHEENKVTLEIDGIKYILVKYLSGYIVIDIEMSKPIFETFEMDDEILSKLFGTKHLDYNVPNFSINKKEKGYSIKLTPPVITG